MNNKLIAPLQILSIVSLTNDTNIYLEGDINNLNRTKEASPTFMLQLQTLKSIWYKPPMPFELAIQEQME